tara:strand:+ start:16014 stop:16793 length:780 start_codon:yes stop_codon:yes gene_type:complete
MEDDKDSASKALKIIEERFDKSTEIYKEFRLFNALAKSSVSNSAVAAAILTEAKSAARRCDRPKLDKEKSLLIRDINYKLADSSFYHRRIPEYKVYATIQTLLNDWRAEDSAPLTRVIQYESKVAEQLMKEKNDISLEDQVSSDVNSLVVNIMTEKINKKYSGSLDSEQRSVLQDYVFSLSDEKDSRIRNKLHEIRESCLKDLDLFKQGTASDFLLNKIDSVKGKILKESFNTIDDDSISRFLVIMQLRKELKGALNER